VRVNAEDPDTFFPSLGCITRLSTPGGPGVRLDAILHRGLEVTPHYDSMLGKLIVHAADRDQAIARMRRALGELRIVGVRTSIPAALRVLADPGFRAGQYDTSILEHVDRRLPAEVEELAALAAAVARFRGTERPDALGVGGEAVESTAPWVMVGRMENLGRRP
jgi:acetyl-CoA carboxylase biotin carboxylase subunit